MVTVWQSGVPVVEPSKFSKRSTCSYTFRSASSWHIANNIRKPLIWRQQTVYLPWPSISVVQESQPPQRLITNSKYGTEKD